MLFGGTKPGPKEGKQALPDDRATSAPRQGLDIGWGRLEGYRSSRNRSYNYLSEKFRATGGDRRRTHSTEMISRHVEKLRKKLVSF